MGVTNSNMQTVGVWQQSTTRHKQYNRGVVYFLNKEYRVAGVILWNVSGRTEHARKVIYGTQQYFDPSELLTKSTYLPTPLLKL